MVNVSTARKEPAPDDLLDRRHNGYVNKVTTSEKDGVTRQIVHVTVKDEASPYNRRRFVAASVRNDIWLQQGLNVSFLVGNVDDEDGKAVLRAVDVSLR